MDFVALAHWLHQYTVVPVMAVFVLMVVATYWPGRKRDMEQNARIPLDDDR